MYLAEELASERIRTRIEHARQIRSARKYRALSRARRTEQKAERRLIEAWQARAVLESKISTE
jgi:hypothetical protein